MGTQHTWTRAGVAASGFAVLMIVAAAAWAYGSHGANADSAAHGSVSVAPGAVELGGILPDDDTVSARVTVTNAGDGILTLHRLSTSCGCTTAEMAMDDMAPGESRTMTITFDPSVHPDVTGPIVRAVYLQTSDPDLPEASIDVTGTVLAREPL